MILFLVIALMYLTAGTFAARSINARQRFELEVAKERDLAEAGSRVFKEDVQHGSTCYKNPNSEWYRPHRECDCSKRAHYNSLPSRDRHSHAAKAKVTPPIVSVAAWPLIGYNSFLTGGEVKRANPYLIERLNREADEALAKELESK